MEVYPAVDLYEGKVVRLERGDFEKVKVYSKDPAETARRWRDEGAEWLHVVDLEGARFGEVKNWGALEKILSAKRVSVQFGGGIRRLEELKRLLQLGIERVILGTKVLDPLFLREATKSFGKKLGLSLDLRGEEVQVEGWVRGGGKSIFDLFHEIRAYSVDCLVLTDIERDGTLTGMNLAKIKRLLEKVPFPVLLSGGVAGLEDIRSLLSLQSERLKGVIIGKALYEGRLTLSAVLRLLQERKR